MRRRLALALVGLGLVAPAGAAAATAPAPPRVLVYSGTAGFRHISIDRGKETLARLARITGRYTVEQVDRPEQLTPARLGASDVVLWLSTTGAESPFTDGQQAAYVDWVSCGGGHIGVHASTDSYRDWPEWTELTGAYFKSHPITPTSAADDQLPEHEGFGEPEARVLVQDGASPITSPWHGRASFLLRDELYAFDRDPSQVIADFRPMLAFGGFTDPAVALQFGSAYAAEQPLAWTGTFRGRNRLAYTNLGHAVATWGRNDFQDHLLETIAFVAGRRPDVPCLRRAGILPPEPAAKQRRKRTTKKKNKQQQRRPAGRRPQPRGPPPPPPPPRGRTTKKKTRQQQRRPAGRRP